MPEPVITGLEPSVSEGTLCASFVSITVTASAPVPPSLTAAIAMESKAISVVAASDSATPTLTTFAVEKKLEGIVKLKLSEAPDAPSVYEVSSVIPSPVNLKKGFVKFDAVAVNVRVPLGLGLALPESYAIAYPLEVSYPVFASEPADPVCPVLDFDILYV